MIATLIRKQPLVSFFFLAFAITWACVLLSRWSLAFGFLGLFGPAVAAVAVVAVEGGGNKVKALFAKIIDWRARPIWFAVALGLPFILTAAAMGLHMLLGGAGGISIAAIDTLAIVLAVMVLGEELGWRGFALPRLMDRFNPLTASLILGVLWATWHLGNATIPGLERYWTAFPAFLLFVLGQTLLFTWIALNTRGSVLFAWIFHAAINTSGAVFAIADPVRQWWLSGITFAVAAALSVPALLRSRGLSVAPE